jgi:hypothetical protein
MRGMGELDVEMFGTCWIPVTVTDPSSVHCTKIHAGEKEEVEKEESQNQGESGGGGGG